METATYFQGEGEEPHRQRESSRKRCVQIHQDKRTRRRFKVSVGISGKQVINSKDCWAKATAAQARQRVSPKVLEHLFGISKLGVQLRSRWRRLRRRRKQAKRLGRSTQIECTALDLCATAMTQQEVVNPRWIAFTVDTGAGGTVWPMHADYAITRRRQVKWSKDRDRFRVGHQLHMAGDMTSVHKPLLIAGDVIDKGHALWLDGNVGCIIQKDTAMRSASRKVVSNIFVEWSH